MINEADLHEAIVDLATEADSAAVVDHLLDARRARSISHRSRLLLPIVTAIVVAALAIGAAIVLSDRDSKDRTASAAAVEPCTTATVPSFTTFSVGSVPDLDDTITDATACAGYRTRSYYTTSGGLLGVITLYRSGVFDPAIARNGRRVTGSGVTGYYVRNVPDPVSGVRCGAEKFGSTCSPGIAWEYATSAWATISADIPDSAGGVAKIFFGTNPIAKLLAVAAAVRPRAGHDLVSPFRLGELAGTRPLAAGMSTTSLRNNDVGQAGARLELAVPGDGVNCARNAACMPAITISVNSTSDRPGASLGDFRGRHVQVGASTGLLIPGREAPDHQRQLRFQSRQWVAVLRVVSTRANVTDAQLLTLARSMSFAPSTTNSATWYAFEEAVPR